MGSWRGAFMSVVSLTSSTPEIIYTKKLVLIINIISLILHKFFAMISRQLRRLLQFCLLEGRWYKNSTWSLAFIEPLHPRTHIFHIHNIHNTSRLIQRRLISLSIKSCKGTKWMIQCYYNVNFILSKGLLLPMSLIFRPTRMIMGTPIPDKN